MKKNILFTLMLAFTPLFFVDGNNVKELKAFICHELSNIEGWCNKKKAVNLIDLVLQVKPDVCVEIGVFGGSSLYPIATTLKFLGKGIVIGIDPWDNRECIKCFDPELEADHLKWWSHVNLFGVYTNYVDLIRKYELEDYCLTMVSSSAKAAPFIGTIDILHIDGNPCEDNLMQDLTLYLPKVRSGGYICVQNSKLTNKLLADSCEYVKVIDDSKCALFKKK